MKRTKREIAKQVITLTLCALMGWAAADELEQPAEMTVETRTLALSSGQVSFPVLSGVKDEINTAITREGGVTGRLARMTALSGTGLTMTSDYRIMTLNNGILSCLFSAQGALQNTLDTFEWTGVNIDLETGEVIPLAALFTDYDAALAAMEEELEYGVAPAFSAHLRNNEITPVPEMYVMNEAGLTLLYPIRQLSTLSDRAGAVQLAWYQVEGWLNLTPGSPAERVGAAVMLGEISRETLETCLQAKTLPGLPVALGDGLAEIVAEYRMLNDSDLMENARIFELEDAAFRDVMVLTDALTESVENSVVQGLRTTRCNLCGLITGRTEREAWLEALGEPDASVTLTGEAAEAMRLPDGVSDYYSLGEVLLCLHSGEDGTLYSVTFTE